MKKRILSVLLSLCMVCTLLPTTALATGEHSNHPICGANCTDGESHSNQTWTGVSSLSQITSAGNYYLTADVTLTGTWKPADGTVLCLNGHTITAGGNFDAIEVTSQSYTLTLCDCKPNGIEGCITHSSGKTGHGVNTTGIFNMYGGTISGNTAGPNDSGGGGVYVGGRFNMYGGTISGNETKGSSSGGGVFVASDKQFTMNGGTITGNSANSHGGGVCVVSGGRFTMTGGQITGNTTASGGSGGGVFSVGTFTMTGGTINGNTATSSGGGVCVLGSDSTFTMSGGSITGNTTVSGGSGGNGGGVYVGSGSTFTMSGGTIGGTADAANTAKSGGGVFSVGTFNMSGTASITGNEATGTDVSNGGGGVYVNERGAFNMSGDASITDNTANSHGGGVYVYRGRFEMSGGSITENEANSTGGGVYVTYSGTFTMSGGSITGNTATGMYGSGGGVHVIMSAFEMSGNASITGNKAIGDEGFGGGVYVSGSPFTMSENASITGNKATNNGGGVYVNAHTFTMYGNASITGNEATNNNGGGVYVSTNGTFKMSGDASITDNTASYKGGGVYVDNSSAMTVSGGVKITDNKKGENAYNVHLPSDSSGNSLTITVAGELEAEASIGVTTMKTPTSEVPVTIAQGTAEPYYRITDNDAKHFFPDERSKYSVFYNNDNFPRSVDLKAHQHDWEYTLSTTNSTNDTITATCKNGSECGNTSETLTISASNATYDGSAKAATLGAQSELKSGLKDATITYAKTDDNTFSGTPTNAGTYTASITVDDQTASVEYTIAKAGLTVTANNHTIIYGDEPANSGVTYSGFVNGENENALGGTLGYTYSYARYGNVGDYAIVPSGLSSDNYAITFVDGMLTVAQREVTLTWNNTDGRTVGDGKTVTATAENLVNSDTVSVTVSNGDQNTAGTYTASATGLTGDKASNYKLPSDKTQDYTIGLAAQTLTFQTPSAVNKTYGNASFTNTATNNRNDGGNVTYSSSNAAVATVNSSTGEVTINGAGTATITATAAAVTEKYSAGSASYTLTISPATVTVAPNTYKVSKVYDGTTNAGSGSGDLSVAGILTGDNVTVIATPVAYTDPNVGGQANMNVSIALTGAKAGNYQLASSTVSVPCEISKKNITISGATVENKDYDSTNTATVTAVTIPGVSGNLSMGTDFTVTSATFPDADADDANVNVTITVALQGTAAGNYTLTNANYVATSAAKINRLDISDADFGIFAPMTYTGEAQTPAATVTKNGLPATGTWSNVTNVTDTTTFTASGNFTGTIADKPTGMAKKTVDALNLTSLVTAPVKGGTPQSSMTSQEQYTGTITWSPSPAKFLGNTVYTATLTLTATDNYTFTGVAANSFTHTGATTVANAADSGTVTITFPATSNAAVSGIVIKTAATKTAYKVGDTLDVTGLVITATMDDTTTADVPVTSDMVTGFHSSAVAASQTLTITYGGQTTTYTISVGKADQTITAANVTAVYGDTGKSVVATNTTAAEGGKIPGALSYAVTAGGDVVDVDAATGALTIKKAGTATVTVTAAATDTCAPATKTVTVTVNKKAVAEPTVSGTYTYTSLAQTVTLTGVEDCMTVSGDTAIAAGDHTVTVNLDGNHQWAAGSDGSITWTIAKATPTGTPTYTAITTGGKTLGDAPLAIGSITPDGGTITWDLGNAQTVAANTAYSWTYTPSDTTNYNNLTGSITPYVVSYSSGSYTPPTYKVESEVTEDTDGSVSVSKSNAKKGDTVTITVTPDLYYKVDGVTVKDSSGNEIAVTDNGDGTFTFQMPDSKVTVEPVFSWDNPFGDVAEDTYYAPAVEWALKNNVTNGTGDGTTFSPDASCTRAQIVTFLWKAAGCPEPASKNSFTDVSADAYYAKAVAWAVEQGITSGTGGGKFSPDASCTRSQSMTLLYHAAGSPEVADSISFSDIAAGSYYADAVVWATQNGVTSGTSATTFSPNAACTRGQIMTFLYRWMVK